MCVKINRFSFIHQCYTASTTVFFMMATSLQHKITIVGSGLVGKSWAMIFASAGYEVWMYDNDPDQVNKALDGVRDQIDQLEKDGNLRGSIGAKEQKELIHASHDLKQCLMEDTTYVQECVPESLELKKKVWKEVDDLISSDQTILASSSSAILPSKISEDLKHRNRFIVAHPVNPPYFAPMVEVVPAPWTSEATRLETRRLMELVGQVPVSLAKELPGFVLNRIQYAILNEYWYLAAKGVVSVDDLDVVMRDGLGMRYAFCGPMEVIHLNAEGTQNYVDRYGHTIFNISNQLGGIPTAWKQETKEGKEEVKRIADELEKLYPLEKLDERRRLRDSNLAALAKLKKQMPK